MEEENKDIELAEVLEAPVEVETEVVNEEVETTQEEEAVAEEEVIEPEPAAEEPEKENINNLRFKTIRDAREKAERERDEFKQRLEAIERSKHPLESPKEQEYEDYAIAPDDLVEGKHLSKYDRELQAMKRDLSEYKQQLQTASVEGRLKMQYPDFETIVNKENIEVLRAAYPEIATTISTSKDLYSQAVSAYTIIKKLGIVPDSSTLRSENRIKKNSSKPLPTTSIQPTTSQDSPLTHANSFAQENDEELRIARYADLQRRAKGG